VFAKTKSQSIITSALH